MSEFIDRLRDIVTDEIYIGSSKSDLPQEIRTNMWCIAATQQECAETNQADILQFLNKVVSNRKAQIQNSQANHGMIFYLWFDEQAAQLRFNLISDFHEHLPFGCSLRVLDRPDAIIDAFLQSTYHDGIPFSELHELDVSDAFALDSDDMLESDYVLNVYKANL